MAEHEPSRLAPGETGTVFLRVHVRRGQRVDTGGRLEMDSQQGPLTFGTAKWDRPFTGKPYYDDTFLIRIPVSIEPGTGYSIYEFRGTLHVTSAPPGDPSRVSRASERQQSFTGRVRVGPPLPRPPRKKRIPRTTKLEGAAPSQARKPLALQPEGIGTEAGAPTVGGATTKKAAKKAAKKAESLELDGGTNDGGLRIGYVVMAAVLGAVALLLRMRRRRRT